MEDKKDFSFAKVEISDAQKSTFEYKNTWKEVGAKFANNKLAIVGTIVFLSLIILSVIFSLLPNYDTSTINSDIVDQGASSSHWWGTDSVGRDFWSRNWGALQYSLLLAFVTTTINILIAIAIGLSMGYFVKFDKYFSFVIRILYAMPTIIVLILFAVVFDTDSSFLAFWVLVLSLTFSGWVDASQQIRGITIKTRNLDFITASQTLGTKRFKILGTFFTYSLPIIIVQFVIIFPKMIISESILGFLGLSIPDIPTLGNLINDGRAPFLVHPYQLLIPLGMLVVTTVSIQFIGFGVEDALLNKGE